MADLKVHENTFRYICGNQNCNHLFDLEDFLQVALLWGFICLVSSENKIIGITCPHCQNTTFRKYPIENEDFSIELLEAKWESISQANVDTQFREFIPFSKRILFENFANADVPYFHRQNFIPYRRGQNIIEELFPEQFNDEAMLPDADEEVFSLPREIKPLEEHYPKIVSEEFPYAFTEDYLNHLCQIEFQYRLKAIPRIVSNNSVYRFLDVQYRAVPDHYLSKKLRDLMADNFEHLVDFQNISSYNYLILDAPLSEYKSSFREMLKLWDSKNVKDKFTELFKSYARVRNQIDFDLNYRDKFVRNFILEFVAAIPEYAFFQEGDSWTIIFDHNVVGRKFRGNGFKHIHYLISNPNQEIKTIALDEEGISVNKHGEFYANGSNKQLETKIPSGKQAGNSENKLDNKALRDYKKRLIKLAHDRSIAEANSDRLHIRDIDEETAKIKSELSKYVGLSGKKKKFETDQSRIKNKITKSIERALNNIEKENSIAYKHLYQALKPINSFTLSYRPVQEIDWQLTP